MLNTCPVGVPPLLSPPAAGMVIAACPAAASGVPEPLYSVARPLPLSETQNGEVGDMEMPQGLIRLGSITAAGTAPSDTRLVCVTVVVSAERFEALITFLIR